MTAMRGGTEMRTAILVCCFALSATAFAGDPPTTYGAGIEDGDTVTPADWMADPDAYVDQVVRISGTVTDVCPMAGCSILVGGSEGPEFRVKDRDGEIVFPKERKDRGAVVPAVFRRPTPAREQALTSAAHEAEERGLPFDPETADTSTTIDPIEGSGAVVR